MRNTRIEINETSVIPRPAIIAAIFILRVDALLKPNVKDQAPANAGCLHPLVSPFFSKEFCISIGMEIAKNSDYGHTYEDVIVTSARIIQQKWNREYGDKYGRIDDELTYEEALDYVKTISKQKR